MKTLDGNVKTLVAVAPNTGSSAAGNITGVKIDGSGFNRARFVFSFGPLVGSANISSGVGIWYASVGGSSSGTWTSLSTAILAAISSGAISQATAVIDTKIKDGYPWLQVSGFSNISSNIVNSVTVDLYDGTRKNPPTTGSTQVVVV